MVQLEQGYQWNICIHNEPTYIDIYIDLFILIDLFIDGISSVMGQNVS